MPEFFDSIHMPQVIRTAVLLALVLLGRWITISRLRAAEGMSKDMQRRWSAQVRLVSLLLLVLGLLLIWGTELKTFALSVVAIAAAIVIATKELIMCVSGTLLRASGKSFQIGDRIEIGTFRGDVVDQTLLTTTILEVGPGTNIHQHTGRTIVIPNSVLLTTPVLNETFLDEYMLHAFSVPLGTGDDWTQCERALLEAARNECKPFMKEAQEHIEHTVRKEGLDPLSVEPRVTLRIESKDQISMLARIPVPARRKGRIEQAILRRYLAWLSEHRAAGDSPESPAAAD
jgi:small-conductance mechanosensitive channel